MNRDVPAPAQFPPELREALDRLVADATGLFGAKPLARLVATHLALFTELRRHGASWAQVAGLLASVGIVGSEDSWAADVLRATYARAAKAGARAETDIRAQRSTTKRDATNRNTVKRGTAKRIAAKDGGTDRDAMKRNDAKLGRAVSEELAHRFLLINKSWHMR